MLIGPPSETPYSTARSEPPAFKTACRSSTRSSMDAVPSPRSERPLPRLSKMISRLNDAIRLSQPPVPCSSNGNPGAMDHHEIDWSVAQHLIGEENVTIACVLRLRNV